MDKPRLILDLDGVIRDFITGLKIVYQRVYPDHPIKEVNSRKLEDFFPIGKDIYTFIDEHYLEEILLESPPYPGAIEAMREWEDKFENVIATAQPEHWRYPTFIWLGKHRVPTNEIHICFDKSRVDGLALLDDFVDNLKQFRASGRLAVCLDQPWNRDWEGPRVQSVSQFFELVYQHWKNGKLNPQKGKGGWNGETV